MLLCQQIKNLHCLELIPRGWFQDSKFGSHFQDASSNRKVPQNALKMWLAWVLKVSELAEATVSRLCMIIRPGWLLYYSIMLCWISHYDKILWYVQKRTLYVRYKLQWINGVMCSVHRLHLVENQIIPDSRRNTGNRRYDYHLTQTTITYM